MSVSDGVISKIGITPVSVAITVLMAAFTVPVPKSTVAPQWSFSSLKKALFKSSGFEKSENDSSYYEFKYTMSFVASEKHESVLDDSVIISVNIVI